MIRYTTPTLDFRVKGIDLTVGNKDLWVSIEQGNVELEKRGADLTVTTDTHEQVTDTLISVMLTQTESASFCENAKGLVQVNWIDENGVRGATNIKAIDIYRNLLNKVIEYGN